MNFFCSSTEFDAYVTEMNLNQNMVIKADMGTALVEARETFLAIESKEGIQDGEKRMLLCNGI